MMIFNNKVLNLQQLNQLFISKILIHFKSFSFKHQSNKSSRPQQYMKNSYKNNRDYYPDISRDINSSTRSLAQRRHNLSSSKVSDSKSKFQNRIQKVCQTNSLQAYKKQISLLKKQVQRLQKQNFKKDHRIFQMQSNYSLFRQLDSQLQQTYRIIYMYEGKIQQLEKYLKRLQQKINKNLQTPFTAEQIQSIFNEFRDDNVQMRGTIQGQNRIIIQLEEKLRHIQSKYFQTSWKLSSQNRVIANPLKKKFPKLRDTIVIQQMSLSQRQKMMNQLQNKYQGISKQNVKEALKLKGSGPSKQKISVNKLESQEIKDSRFTGVYQTPRSPKLSNNYISRPQSASQNYTMQKIQSTPKVYGNQYRQNWQTDKQGRSSYNFYRVNQTRKSQFSSQSQPMSLNYSVSQGPIITSQRSPSPQNGVTSYNVSTSQSGYAVSQNSKGPQNRLVSDSKVISNNGTMLQSPTIYRSVQRSSTINTAQNRQGSLSPSNRIIRISRDNMEPSYSTQNRNGVTYYQGSQSIGSSLGNGDNKKIRYIMKPS